MVKVKVELEVEVLRGTQIKELPDKFKNKSRDILNSILL